MRYIVLKSVVSVILSYLPAYLLDLAIARYQLWEAENRLEKAHENLRK